MVLIKFGAEDCCVPVSTWVHFRGPAEVAADFASGTADLLGSEAGSASCRQVQGAVAGRSDRPMHPLSPWEILYVTVAADGN